MKRPLTITLLAVISLIAISLIFASVLISVTSETESNTDSEYNRFKELGRDKIWGDTQGIIEDIETGCQYVYTNDTYVREWTLLENTCRKNN